MQRWLGVAALVAAGACDSGASAGETDGETDGASSGASTGVDESAGGTTDPGSGGSASASGSTTGTSSTSAAETTQGSNGETGLPDGDGCCDPHEGEGCEEVAIEQCVCAALPQCCLFSWIEECADLAQSRCEATCESDDSGSTGSTGSETGSDTSAEVCDEPVVLELGVADAELTGNWVPSVSEVGEGDIAVLMGGPNGAVTWDVDVPCEDTWYIWVRYWEQGNDDSYFVTLDGAPDDPAIFEGDCSGAGQGYDWRLLNERGDSPCVYLQDPWAPQWDAGAHEVSFSFRESIALGRIVVTNDPEYAP